MARGCRVNDDNIRKGGGCACSIRFDNQQTTMTPHVTRRVQSYDGV
jgi:hypothetical protein